jgi:hypothetical protein|nr:hypothetical protein [Phenylobacterium sp.]
MKAFTVAASAAVLACAIPAIAAAQAAPDAGLYGTLGYANTNDSGADLGTIQGRLGYRFNHWLGVEGELATGVKSDNVSASVAGATATGKAKLQSQEAIYGLGFLPLNGNWDLLGRIGYGHSKVSVNDITVTGAGAPVGNLSGSASGNSWNFGVGAQYHWDAQNGVRADYTREEFTGNGNGHADVLAIAYSRKF